MPEGETALAQRVDPVLRIAIHIIHDTLRAKNGNITLAAEELNVAPGALRRRVYETPSLMDLLQDILESKLDMVEDQMLDAAMRGHPASARFVLSTLGAGRGYSPDRNTGNTVNFTVVRPEEEEARAIERADNAPSNSD